MATVDDQVAGLSTAVEELEQAATNAPFFPQGLHPAVQESAEFAVAVAAVAVALLAELRGQSGEVPGVRGFWTDDASGANVHRLRDRLFVGAAAQSTGRRTAPYGGTALTENIATWPEKNAQAVIGSANGRIGLLGWTNLSDDDVSGTSIGVAGFARAKKAVGTSRGLYGDATREAGAAGVFGLEVAVTNRGDDVTGNAYGVAGGAIGIHATPEGSSGYTAGDSDTPVATSTAPGTVALNIAAGSGGTANKRWNMGIRFGSNSLTGCDGVTGTAKALELAKGHELNWMASAEIQGAKIRSDVTAVAGQDVAQVFEPNEVSFYGTTGSRMFGARHAANGVNNLYAQNAATGFVPSLRAEGADTNVGMFFIAKGQAAFRFQTQGGANEDMRVGGVSSAPVNYLHAYGSGTGAGYAAIEAKGSDADINVRLLPKGTNGRVQFGSLTAGADAPITGYIEIKDAGGTVRKLAVIG